MIFILFYSSVEEEPVKPAKFLRPEDRYGCLLLFVSIFLEVEYVYAQCRTSS